MKIFRNNVNSLKNGCRILLREHFRMLAAD